ncbi:MAG: hypothetical protein ABSH34_28000 [Verrucomicrobiota bacterium]
MKTATNRKSPSTAETPQQPRALSQGGEHSSPSLQVVKPLTNEEKQ